MSTDIYYFELHESRTGRLRLEFMGSEFDVRLQYEYLGSRHFKADEIGISVDSVYLYLAASDDFYNHIGIHGHHESEEGLPPEEWSEEKKKYENMRYVRKAIEDEWNEIASTLGDRVSEAGNLSAAINGIVF